MTYEQARCVQPIPLFGNFNRNRNFLNEVITKLQPTVYLPDDYIALRVNQSSHSY